MVWLAKKGKHMIDYQFDKEELIFAYDQVFKFNTSTYWDEKQLKKMDLNLKIKKYLTDIKRLS